MVELPVESRDGSLLLAFDRIAEVALAGLDPAVPLAASLVVLWYGHGALMVFNRFRHGWELPGGMLDPGESPRAAAFRELAEESGQRPAVLDLAGVARTQLADSRLENLAIYRGRITEPMPFAPNEEISHSCWWNPREELADLDPFDAALARLCAP